MALALVGAGLSQSPGTRRADPATAGGLVGRAMFSGAPPAPEMLSMSADSVCGVLAGASVPSQAVLVDRDGGLQNAFVHIK
jgi:hypothetical protein